MATYKLTYNIDTLWGVKPEEFWFSDRKSAVAFAKSYLRLYYFPVLVEKFPGEDFVNGKTTYLPTIAVRHFFNGGLF